MTDDDQIQTTAEAHEAAALPCARAVHANPDAPLSAEQLPLPDAMSRKPVAQKKPCRMGL